MKRVRIKPGTSDQNFIKNKNSAQFFTIFRHLMITKASMPSMHQASCVIFGPTNQTAAFTVRQHLMGINYTCRERERENPASGEEG